MELLQAEYSPEMMLLACRCLCNLVEALPGSAPAVVDAGAASALTAKLLNIEYMDLAEQALTTLEKLSVDFPLPILRAGGTWDARTRARTLLGLCVTGERLAGLSAVLAYLDFFSTGVQRSAVTTAANLCRRVPPDDFHFAADAVPTLTNLLRSHDGRVVERAVVAFARYGAYLWACECIAQPDGHVVAGSLTEAVAQNGDRLATLAAHGLGKNLVRLEHETVAAPLCGGAQVCVYGRCGGVLQIDLLAPGSAVTLAPATCTMALRILSTLCHHCPTFGAPPARRGA
jgi:hypothetical protein